MRVSVEPSLWGGRVSQEFEMAYRSTLDALTERERALEREVQRLRGPQGLTDDERILELNAELETVREALASRNPKRRRHRIIIRRSDCATAWHCMAGDEQVQACHTCGARVYNLSELTSDEAYELVTRYEGRPQKRLYRRLDGRVLAKPCPAPLWRTVSRLATVSS